MWSETVLLLLILQILHIISAQCLLFWKISMLLLNNSNIKVSECNGIFYVLFYIRM